MLPEEILPFPGDSLSAQRTRLLFCIVRDMQRWTRGSWVPRAQQTHRSWPRSNPKEMEFQTTNILEVRAMIWSRKRVSGSFLGVHMMFNF